MNNFVISLIYTNHQNTKKTFKITGLKNPITEVKALEALQQLPGLGGFVDADGAPLYVNPVQADVTQTVKTTYTL